MEGFWVVIRRGDFVEVSHIMSGAVWAERYAVRVAEQWRWVFKLYSYIIRLVYVPDDCDWPVLT